jgi:hypothetical protein
MKLSGWKRQTGAAAMAPMVIAMAAEKFLNVDTGEWDKYLALIAMFGGLPLYVVGWIDKVLPFTVKLEKLLEWFNAWAAKQGQKGSVSVKQIVGATGIIAVALTGNGIQDKALTEKVTADIEKSIDSLEVAELKTADVKVVVAVENNSGEKQNPYHKYNPLKYYKAGDSVIVIVRDGATDSLMSRRTIVADKDGSLFVDKSGMVAPSVAVSVDGGVAVEPIEEIPSGTK